jgi:hypothetical protein
MVDCRSNQAFPNSSGSASVLPFGCRSRALPPAFLSRRFRVYLKGPRIPLESPIWHDRFFWQNPVRVTRLVPLRRWPFLPPSCRPAGRPSDSLAFRPAPASRPSLSFLRPQPFGRWVSSNGGFKLLPEGVLVKGEKVLFRKFYSPSTSAEISKFMNKKGTVNFQNFKVCDEANSIGQ